MLVACFFSVTTYAQIDYDQFPPATTTLFLNDAVIHTAPGVEFGLGDMIIEDGLIKEIGQNLNVPANAKVIECDSCRPMRLLLMRFRIPGCPSRSAVSDQD